MPRALDRHYRCRLERPADFDDFWDGLLAKARALPLDAELTPDPLRSTAEAEVFQARYTSLDRVRIFGWYARPRGATGSLPAIIQVPGYISDPSIPKPLARAGYAAFSAAPRGKIRSNAQVNPGYPGLLSTNLTDRNTHHYRGFYLDAARVVDFLLTRREVDPARIGVAGSSQGGALALVVAGLRPEIAAASVGAPYLCGIMECAELASTYPYHEIRDYLRLYPDRRAAVERTLAYFDCIHFAARVRCPLIMNIGRQDNVCPPESGYQVFDAAASAEKRLYEYDGHGHDAGSHRHREIVAQFFAERLRP